MPVMNLIHMHKEQLLPLISVGERVSAGTAKRRASVQPG